MTDLFITLAVLTTMIAPATYALYYIFENIVNVDYDAAAERLF